MCVCVEYGGGWGGEDENERVEIICLYIYPVGSKDAYCGREELGTGPTTRAAFFCG